MRGPRTRRHPKVIGAISDTHGLIRPQALAALAGSDLIIHAGDIGTPDVLTALTAIAPVAAVRGNNDHGAWTRQLTDTAAVQVGNAWVYVLHDLQDLDLDPAAAGFAAVIAGHSHRPGITKRDGVLYVNPGSAGARRFHLPIAVARLHLRGVTLSGEVVLLRV